MKNRSKFSNVQNIIYHYIKYEHFSSISDPVQSGLKSFPLIMLKEP